MNQASATESLAGRLAVIAKPALSHVEGAQEALADEAQAERAAPSATLRTGIQAEATH